jgi:hypothetical protein
MWTHKPLSSFAARKLSHRRAVPLLAKRMVGRCHEAQFCSDGSLFLDRFSHFIGTALKNGSTAVFIGTASHRISLFERLHADSQETRAAIRQGRYFALDAVEFLSNVMVDDMPDTGWFLKAVGDLVASAASGAKGTHSRVAACGEWAPFLWAEGKADAAIRLEELWNEIAEKYDVDILWKASAAKKTVTPFVESVKNTQLSGLTVLVACLNHHPKENVGAEFIHALRAANCGRMVAWLIVRRHGLTEVLQVRAC